MNSPKNFLMILGLFSIFGHLLDGAMAQPLNKKGSLFNYDDEMDYFQLQGQQKPGHKEEYESGKNLYQMPAKPVLSEDDAELALMSDMSIYTDDDVAWEHEHGRSGIFRGIPKAQKLRSLSACKKPQPQPQAHAPPLPMSMPLYSSYPLKDTKPYVQKNILDPTDMSIGKWNWMEKILRQQAERF